MSYQDEHKLETYKSLISISTESFKALQYLNGGAILAVLTYLGKLPSPSAKILELAQCPLTLYILGLLCGTFVYATAYFTQFALHNEHDKTKAYKGAKHQTWLILSLLLCLLSLAFFAGGTYSVLSALTVIALTAC